MGVPVNTQFFKEHSMWGVLALDVTNKALKTHNLSVIHDFACTTFEVSNSQNLQPNQLYSMIYSKDADFEGCFPHIEMARSREGNLTIVFKKLKPQVQPLKRPPGYMSKYFGQPLPDDPKEIKKVIGMSNLSECLPAEDVEKIQHQISKSIVETMTQIMAPKTGREGIWYPNAYKEKYPEMPPEWREGHADERYFMREGRFNFTLLPGAKPSDAVRSFLKGPTIADCGNAVVICCYKALLDAVGDEKFDQFFGDPQNPLKILQVEIDMRSTLSYFCRYTKAANQMDTGEMGKRTIKIGDQCAFKGIPYYPLKHPDGFAASWNVIFGGYNENHEQIFYAHGFPKPMTEREILKLLFEEYNLERTPGDLKCIQGHANPEIYSVEQNENLKNNYTVPGYMMDYLTYGWAGALVKCLEPKYVYLLKNATDMNYLLNELKLRRTLSMFKIKPGENVVFGS